MKKRGQITIFIIVAIIIVFGIILFFYSQTSKDKKFQDDFITGEGLNEQASVIRSNVFDCIDQTTLSALAYIGVQGGHYTKPEKYFSNEVLEENNIFFSYYYYEGENLMPTMEEIQNSVGVYIKQNLLTCFNDKDYPLATTFSQPGIKAFIKDKEIEIIVDTQIKIEDEGTTSTVDLKDEVFRYPSKLKGMIEIADYLTSYHKIDPKYYCINCVGLMAYERGVNVDITEFIEENTKQVIIYENDTYNPDLYFLTYLNKYTGDEKSPEFDE